MYESCSCVLCISALAYGRPIFSIFFLHVATPPESSTLSLHDALPIFHVRAGDGHRDKRTHALVGAAGPPRRRARGSDRKSTRLNSSHLGISYAVFCLKKKKNEDKKYR